MNRKFRFEDITYEKPAPGWADGVYYPRDAQIQAGERFLKKNDASREPGCADFGIWKLHSRVWQEIEETGFGIYYYEETTRIVTELSGENYEVRLLLRNPEDKPYSCHVRVNGIVKESGVEVAPGEEKQVAFTACMTDGQFVLTLTTGILEEIHEEAVEGDIYLGGIEIWPEQKKEKRETPRIFLVSDSTVQSYEKYFYPQTGWGQVLCQFFKGAEAYQEYPAEHCDYSQGRTYELPGLVIENRSIGGRSARSFYDEGKLDQILEVVCPGDYMFVQFAHNDATAIRPNRYIAPEDFAFYLQRYIDACDRRGVQLVLVTPVTMLVPEADGSNKLCFAEYREEMMKLAEEKNISLLDLSGRSNAYVNKIGFEEGKNLYMWFGEGEYPDGAYAGGVSDKCHLREYGAKVYANAVVQMIAEYEKDNRLDVLKELAAPVLTEAIQKPARRKNGRGETTVQETDAVTGFVVQEISVENGRGSFLLNWNLVEDATAYHIYGRKEKELTFSVVKSITREEKAAFAVLPFTAEAGVLWQYFVVPVFANGSEGRASRIQEVDLR